MKGDELAEYGLRREHLERRVYVKTATGQVLSGVAALASLWSHTPGYRWLSKAVSLSVVRPVADMLYDHVAVPLLTASEKGRRPKSASHGRILGS
jgi:predicted DCC family thiol-disulfide oxidoreductase YuxK